MSCLVARIAPVHMALCTRSKSPLRSYGWYCCCRSPRFILVPLVLLYYSRVARAASKTRGLRLRHPTCSCALNHPQQRHPTLPACQQHSPPLALSQDKAVRIPNTSEPLVIATQPSRGASLTSKEPPNTPTPAAGYFNATRAQIPYAEPALCQHSSHYKT